MRALLSALLYKAKYFKSNASCCFAFPSPKTHKPCHSEGASAAGGSTRPKNRPKEEGDSSCNAAACRDTNTTKAVIGSLMPKLVHFSMEYESWPGDPRKSPCSFERGRGALGHKPLLRRSFWEAASEFRNKYQKSYQDSLG